MDFVPLTEKQRREFDENGYLVVRGALDENHINRLIEAGDRLMESWNRDGFYQHRRPGVVQEAEFARLVSHSPTVPLIVQLLGWNLHITNTALIYKYPQKPTVPESRNWHRDHGAHLDLGHRNLPRVGLKVGYCLTDFTEPDSGVTYLVRHSNNFQAPLTIPTGKVDPLHFDEPRLRAGDAFMFSNRTYHAPGLNFTDRVSRVVMFGYHYRWVKPDYYLRYYNETVQPDEKLLANLDDIGRQLLGATSDSKGNSDPNGIGWLLKDWAEQHNLELHQAVHTVEV